MKILLLCATLTTTFSATANAFFPGEEEMICAEGEPTVPGRTYKCRGISGTWYSCRNISGELVCISYNDSAPCPGAGPGICW